MFLASTNILQSNSLSAHEALFLLLQHTGMLLCTQSSALESHTASLTAVDLHCRCYDHERAHLQSSFIGTSYQPTLLESSSTGMTQMLHWLSAVQVPIRIRLNDNERWSRTGSLRTGTLNLWTFWRDFGGVRLSSEDRCLLSHARWGAPSILIPLVLHTWRLMFTAISNSHFRALANSLQTGKSGDVFYRQVLPSSLSDNLLIEDRFRCADRLFLRELSYERVMDIYELESAAAVVVSVGGQLPQNIALRLQETGKAKVLGTDPKDIDKAEDREKFSQILDSIGVDQPAWKELTSYEEAKKFADNVGYPVLVRPSYVLSGAAMTVIRGEVDLREKLTAAADVSPDHPVVITQFITGAQEIDVDAVASSESSSFTQSLNMSRTLVSTPAMPH
ncbi:hypothetical protein MRB53_036884 [Persea americana]|nr:hypothetical protein MRB53_036884 [Persea americana]